MLYGKCNINIMSVSPLCSGCELVDIMSDLPKDQNPPVEYNPPSKTAVITVDGELDRVEKVPQDAKVYVTTVRIFSFST